MHNFNKISVISHINLPLAFIVKRKLTVRRAIISRL
jgi:hypothetical protein